MDIQNSVEADREVPGEKASTKTAGRRALELAYARISDVVAPGALKGIVDESMASLKNDLELYLNIDTEGEPNERMQ